VGEGKIHLHLDEIPRGNALEPRVPGQDLFRNGHGHGLFSVYLLKKNIRNLSERPRQLHMNRGSEEKKKIG